MPKYAEVTHAIDAFEFTGEVDPVIYWKVSFGDYSPTHFPMSSYMGHALRMGIGEQGNGGEAFAFPGDYIIRHSDNTYTTMEKEYFENIYRQITS